MDHVVTWRSHSAAVLLATAPLAPATPGHIKVLNGRPRHPQTQGLVEKHNSTLKRKLQAWIQDSGGCRHWAQALPEIALLMNHQIHETTGEPPYRVVFKQQMRMQRLSFADRETAIPEDEDLDGSESDIGASDNSDLGYNVIALSTGKPLSLPSCPSRYLCSRPSPYLVAPLPT